MACIDKCPKQCITIKFDKLGHRYPHIIEAKCIDCSACINICPEHNIILNPKPIQVVASWVKKEEKRIQSSSGGLATAISEAIIERKGVVYGCAFIKGFNFKHVRCTTQDELEALKGSKYVQSDTIGCYKKVIKDLKEGREVLFIGTPCQVNAIKRYAKGKDEKLYTIDLVCHGVPSVSLLKESLPSSICIPQISKISFRENTKYHFSIENGSAERYERPLSKDLFLKGFFTALFYRDSCYHCRYAQQQRVGDITLGDFWGVDTKTLHTNIEKGVSLCLVNNNKGKLLLRSETIMSKIQIVERPIEEALNGNKQLNHPMKKSIRSKIFSLLFPITGFNIAVILSIPEIVLKNLIIRK